MLARNVLLASFLQEISIDNIYFLTNNIFVDDDGVIFIVSDYGECVLIIYKRILAICSRA